MKCSGCGQERPKGRMKECGDCGKVFCTVTTPGYTCYRIHKETVRWNEQMGYQHNRRAPKTAPPA